MSDPPDAHLHDQGGQWESLSIVRTFVLLLIPIALLTAISLSLWQVRRTTPEPRWAVVLLGDFFNLDREVNIPTWFTAGLWLATSLLAAVLARAAQSQRRGWFLFAAVCTLMSIDEATSLHERLNPAGAVLAERFDIDLRYAWVIPGAAIALGLVLLLARLVLSLPFTARLAIFLSGVLFVSGALVGEVLGDLSLRLAPLPEALNSPLYITFNAIEESLEMAGVALCFASLLSLLRWQHAPQGMTFSTATTAHRKF